MKDIYTENLTVKYERVDSSTYEVNITVSGQKLEWFNDDTVILPRDLAYHLKMTALFQIPCAIQICTDNAVRERSFSDPHLKTIVDFNDDTVTVAVIIFESKDSYFIEQENDFPQTEYLRAMKQAVIDHPRLRLNPDFLEPSLDLDEQIEAQNMGIKYFPIGPFEFFVDLKPTTYGDLIIELEQISFDLEKTAKELFTQNGGN